jgi:membrane-associated phospholipid phosphatase
MLNKTEYIKLLIFIIIVSVLIFIQHLLRPSLQSVSASIIVNLQKNQHLVQSMRWITLLGSKKIKAFFMCVIYATCNVYHAYFYVLAVFSSSFLCAFLKINLQDPRPFWLYPEVHGYDCEASYGYPSDHVMATVPGILLFFEILYYRMELDRSPNANICYYFGLILSYFICILVSFSRLAMGVHSLDQVFFGLVMGFAFYYFYLHILDYDLRNYTPFLFSISKSFHIHKFCFIIFGLYFSFLINLFLIPANYDPLWTYNFVLHCGDRPQFTPIFKSLIDSQYFFYVIAGFFGILLDIRLNYQGNLEDKNEVNLYAYENISDNHVNRIGRWNDTKWIKTIFRILVLYIPLFLYKLIDPLKNIGMGNLIIQYLVAGVLNCCIVSIYIFGFSKQLCALLRLSGQDFEKHKYPETEIAYN